MRDDKDVRTGSSSPDRAALRAPERGQSGAAMVSAAEGQMPCPARELAVPRPSPSASADQQSGGIRRSGIASRAALRRLGESLRRLPKLLPRSSSAIRRAARPADARRSGRALPSLLALLRCDGARLSAISRRSVAGGKPRWFVRKPGRRARDSASAEIAFGPVLETADGDEWRKAHGRLLASEPGAFSPAGPEAPRS